LQEKGGELLKRKEKSFVALQGKDAGGSPRDILEGGPNDFSD